MGRNSIVAIILIVIMGGCVLPLDSPGVACEPPTFGLVTGPVNAQGGITRETERSIPSLVSLTNRADIELKAVLPDRPTREHAPSRLDLFDVTYFSGNETLGPGASLFALVEYEGGFSGEYPPFEVRASMTSSGAGTCLNEPSASSVYTFVGDYIGEVAEPGVGALVHTAGFWTNGTLFYTNMDSVHNNTSFKRAGWYAYEDGDPLAVYVYNTSREERPQRYNESGFATTIPGFNEGLKHLSTSGSKVVHLMPQEAYTRPGNENHDLYGDSLVFYMQIKDVVAIDCLLPQPVCEAPTVPPASLEGDGASLGGSRGVPTGT